MSATAELQATIAAMVQRGKGILAADESLPTIGKRFAAVGLESTPESRRTYRELLLSAAGLEDFIAAVILFEETLSQVSDAGVPLVDAVRARGIVPGIKVDRGITPLANAPGNKVTEGLDSLRERLADFKAKGARFAKWRAVYPVGDCSPASLAIQVNAECLARYAALCQEAGMVPIVEPEVLLDGTHDIDTCERLTEAVQHEVFQALIRHRVRLEYLVLKPNMVMPGKGHPVQAGPEEVAWRTIRILRRTVPAAVPSINFLSGGQTPQQATANLNALNAAVHAGLPWQLSFSYARALQEFALATWQGKAENAAAAQQALLERAKLTSWAQLGQYSGEPP